MYLGGGKRRCGKEGTYHLKMGNRLDARGKFVILSSGEGGKNFSTQGKSHRLKKFST